jgi:hypothetical protein
MREVDRDSVLQASQAGMDAGDRLAAAARALRDLAPLFDETTRAAATKAAELYEHAGRTMTAEMAALGEPLRDGQTSPAQAAAQRVAAHLSAASDLLLEASESMRHTSFAPEDELTRQLNGFRGMARLLRHEAARWQTVGDEAQPPPA